MRCAAASESMLLLSEASFEGCALRWPVEQVGLDYLYSIPMPWNKPNANRSNTVKTLAYAKRVNATPIRTIVPIKRSDRLFRAIRNHALHRREISYGRLRSKKRSGQVLSTWAPIDFDADYCRSRLFSTVTVSFAVCLGASGWRVFVIPTGYNLRPGRRKFRSGCSSRCSRSRSWYQPGRSLRCCCVPDWPVKDYRYCRWRALH
jgi:hypothetical protein